MRSGAWLVAGAGLAQALGLVKTGVLGRLLSPEEFGLLGVALIVVAWLENFTQTGLTVALVQRPGDIGQYLDTVFTAQLARGVFLCTALVLSAPSVATFFQSPAATNIIRGVATVVLLRGATNPAIAYLRRDVNLLPEVVMRVGAALAGLFTGVAAALVKPDAWALVLSLVAAQLTATLLSYRVRPYRPALRIDAQQLRDLAGFGQWIFLANLLLFLSGSLDSFFVGRLLGPVALGAYQVATQFALRPTSEIGTHVYGVMFPSISTAEDEGQRQRALSSALGLVATATLPLALVVSIFPDAVVFLTVGPKWSAMIPLLPPLAWAGACVALRSIPYAALHGVGRPDLTVKIAVVEVPLLAAAIHESVLSHGAVGAAHAVAAVAGASALVHTAAALHTMRLSAKRLLGALAPAGRATSPLLLYILGQQLLGTLSLYAAVAASVASAAIATREAVRLIRGRLDTA